MPRGGKRQGAGRRKQERPVDGNLAREIKAKIKAKEKWLLVIELSEKKARETGNTADLRNALEYLDDRDWGRTVQPIQQQTDKPLEVHVRISRVGA